MYNPVSSYRVQFNIDFPFKKFRENIQYFLLLNPGAIYSSPFFEAVPASMHGYDVTNPHKINPEIGPFGEFAAIAKILKSYKIGWIQDIVPNHMAFHMNNLWLMDVLEKGRSSKYSDFFDIDFFHPDFEGRLLVPFLGKQLSAAIADKEITAEWNNGSFVFKYFDFYFPFSFDSFREIISSHLANAPASFHKIWYDFYPENEAEFLEQVWPDLKKKIERLYKRLPSFKKFINEILASVNNNGNIIHGLLDQQNYQLNCWLDATQSLNYRRFFTINGLICLNIENDHVFSEYHKFIEEQVRKEKFQGLRVDHIDGLKQPALYLEKLRVLTGGDTYIVTEKILEKDEELRNSLPVQGTSGYDFLGLVNNLFTYGKNLPELNGFYQEFTGINDDIEDIKYEKKKLILGRDMNGELENLTRMFEESEFIRLPVDNITRENIKEAIGEFLIFFPVYKVYSDHFPLSTGDEKVIREVILKAGINTPSLKGSLKLIENVLLFQEGVNPEMRRKALAFFLRCMQFTGPLMAKGVEDTVMYCYNSFIAHNEVGDHPGASGITSAEFHKAMIKRQKFWPLSMNSTSTHDTKRGEDVRARLNVISEMAAEWMDMVGKWKNNNKSFKKRTNGIISPTNNEEYFIYQTITGVFPFESIIDEVFMGRMDEYIVKSLREAKTNSEWNEPNEDHERAVINFTRKILAPGSRFLQSFLPFQQKIAGYGIVNSLTQLMLKATSPGIPDFYQGTELWDLSLVDPDNRRPVDYGHRMRLLEDIIRDYEKNSEETFDDLWLNRTDGRIKLWLTWRLLKERKSEPELFHHGKYIPLTIRGKYKDHVIAFARNHESKWFIVIAPLFPAIKEGINLKNHPDWDDTIVILPDFTPVRWTLSFGGKELHSTGELPVKDILRYDCPAYLKGKVEEPVRSAGVLLHISSLPGRYGTGDLGEEAYEFADLLRNAGQSYWQILPFNPVGKGYGFSPYSSLSAFAGNLLFLSPDKLIEKDLLHNRDIQKIKFRESNRADFIKAGDLRNRILDVAYSNFLNYRRPELLNRFNEFCERENHWLGDYALFVNLKKEFSEAPWNEWPQKIKSRNILSMNIFRKKFRREIEKEMFSQFLFNEQWSAFKNHCNKNGIKLIGDMSIYVNYDSAEVWANPSYFKLDTEKKPTMVAGVPPDYFSKTGQLWNMPVYNWDFMKTDGYKWWIKRIKRSVDLCDIVRFDHFRGFSEYWEVPAGEKTAEKGKWTAGPGNDFLEKVRNEFPGMPFIAEDLGHIDDKVFKLRDNFSLAGMAVLQFAFGDNIPFSGHAPHNHSFNSIVYTGTHDNNTTKGWFMHELSEKNRKLAEEYIGHSINCESCHEEFIRMAYSSVARIAIIPIQDLLGLDENARLNNPSVSQKNWEWKLKKEDLEKFNVEKIRRQVFLFGRLLW